MRSSQFGWTAAHGWGSSDLDEPDLVLFFGATDEMQDGRMGRQLAERFPGSICIGCSSGSIVEGDSLEDEGGQAIATKFDNTRVRLATNALQTACSRQAGQAIGRALAADDLTWIFVLSDGLAVNGSDLVAGLAQAVGPRVTISGGLAGDGARFGRTLVSAGGETAANLVAAVGFYGSAIRVAHGSAGGWDEFGPERQVTRSEGNVLLELNGKPALDLYERYLGEEAAGLPASALLYPLTVWDPADPPTQVVRTVLSVDREARTMTFAGDVPQGWRARLMRGSFDRLTDGAIGAANQALEGISAAGADPALCLFVSCVGRRLLMQQRTEDEVQGVRDVLGQAVAQIGFYSYGEISPSGVSGLCGLHNQTVTLTLVGEAA